MWNIDPNSSISFEEENIFDELSWEPQEQNEELKENTEKEKRWLYDYLKIYSSIALWLNIILFICIILFFVYNYLQKSEEKLTYNFPSFVCQALLWEASNKVSGCSGVEYTLSSLKQDIKSEKQKQVEKIVPLIGDLYSFENFRFSKKMAFLIEKSTNRLQPSAILSSFDELKWKYASVDKSEIECSNIVIEQENILKINCDIYASDWDTEIFYFEDGVKKTNTWWWGSMSKAISFIDYIENDELSPFKVKSKTEQFTSESIQKPPYTQKTSIELELEYFNTDLLLK